MMITSIQSGQRKLRVGDRVVVREIAHEGAILTVTETFERVGISLRGHYFYEDSPWSDDGVCFILLPNFNEYYEAL
jgi:hypothetical protein